MSCQRQDAVSKPCYRKPKALIRSVYLLKIGGIVLIHAMRSYITNVTTDGKKNLKAAAWEDITNIQWDGHNYVLWPFEATCVIMLVGWERNSQASAGLWKLSHHAWRQMSSHAGETQLQTDSCRSSTIKSSLTCQENVFPFCVNMHWYTLNRQHVVYFPHTIL